MNLHSACFPFVALEVAVQELRLTRGRRGPRVEDSQWWVEMKAAGARWKGKTRVEKTHRLGESHFQRWELKVRRRDRLAEGHCPCQYQIVLSDPLLADGCRTAHKSQTDR